MKYDRLRDMQEPVTDYLNLDVLQVRILNPLSHRVYICAHREFREPVGGVLEAAGTTLRIPVDEIIAELD